MPGIDFTSSSAVRRPPARLEIVPPVATSRTRGNALSCAHAAGGSSRRRIRKTKTVLPRGRPQFGMERIQVPIEEGPHAVPRVALLARVLGLPRLRIDAAVERVAARRVVVDHGFGERRLA